MNEFGAGPADTLQEEHRAATSLLRILDEERTCLANADLGALPGVTEQKAAVVGRMTELAQRRQQALAGAGYPQDKSGMAAWLDGPASSPTAGRMWKALLSLAETAKETNRVNGLLLAQHMARNQGALNVLQGSRQGGGFYGPDGQATGKTTTRSLIVG